MKRIGILFFLNLTVLINSENLVTKIELDNKNSNVEIIEKVEVKPAKETSIKGKDHLLNYLKKAFELGILYLEDKINKVIFSKDKEQISYEYYSFEDDKISKKSEIKLNYEKNTSFYLNKKVKSIEEIEGNIKKVEEYYENGNLKTKGKYEYADLKWEKLGNWEEYYENSRLSNKFMYENNGYYQINFNNNEKNTKNYEGKTLYSKEQNYKDGLWTFYNENQISYKAELFKENGKIYQYYDKEAKKLSSITSVVFRNDQWEWEGEKTLYSENGKILENQIKYEDTLYVIGYYPNEKATKKYEGFRDIFSEHLDKLGTWNYYDEEENIEKVMIYSGLKAEVKEYYDFENNKIKFEGNIEKKNNQYSWIGNQVYYNKLGKKDTVIDFNENGHGRIQHFFDNGNIYQEGEVYSDYVESSSYYLGNLKEYDKNGKLKVIYNYSNGLLNGETQFFDNNEKLAVIKIYENGELKKIEKVK